MLIAQVLSVALLAAGAGAAEQDCRSPIPLERKDPVLQTQLWRGLAQAGLGRALAKKQLAVSVLDLTPAGEGAYAGVNDDDMMYAASLPKIGILLATLEEVNRGKIQWGPEFSWRLTKMITISDNSYANWGARLVGLPGIAEILRSPRYCLYQDGVGGIWMGRTFEKEAITHRDPLKNLSHAATTRQTTRFYALLEQGKLVSPYWSRWMLEHMAPPEYVHKFYKALRRKPGVRFLARKSGTWQDFHADSAIVAHDERRFVVVAIAEHEDGEEMMETVARGADELITRGEHRWWR
jgi:beta-lactamase class A